MLFFFYNLVRVILLCSLSRTGDQKNKEYEYPFLFFVLVRVERIELSSQVWKTCILTAVLHSLMGWVIGIEPTTFWTTIRRSNRLSYTHQIFKMRCTLPRLYQTQFLFSIRDSLFFSLMLKYEKAPK